MRNPVRSGEESVECKERFGAALDEVVDRSGTSSMKWQKYEGRDIIPMWVADMDFVSPPCVIKALVDRVRHGVFG